MNVHQESIAAIATDLSFCSKYQLGVVFVAKSCFLLVILVFQLFEAMPFYYIKVFHRKNLQYGRLYFRFDRGATVFFQLISEG